MSRLLFIVVAVAVVYWLLKSYRRQSSANDEAPAPAEDMVRCAQCGVHLPKGESIVADGRYYCSEAHRRTHEGRPE